MLQQCSALLPCLPGHHSICCPWRLSGYYMKAAAKFYFDSLSPFSLSLHPHDPLTSICPSTHHSILFSHYNISTHTDAHSLTYTHIKTPLSGTVETSPSPQRVLHCTAAMVHSHEDSMYGIHTNELTAHDQ